VGLLFLILNHILKVLNHWCTCLLWLFCLSWHNLLSVPALISSFLVTLLHCLCHIPYSFCAFLYFNLLNWWEMQLAIAIYFSVYTFIPHCLHYSLNNRVQIIRLCTSTMIFHTVLSESVLLLLLLIFHPINFTRNKAASKESSILSIGKAIFHIHCYNDSISTLIDASSKKDRSLYYLVNSIFSWRK